MPSLMAKGHKLNGRRQYLIHPGEGANLRAGQDAQPEARRFSGAGRPGRKAAQLVSTHPSKAFVTITTLPYAMASAAA